MIINTKRSKNKISYGRQIIKFFTWLNKWRKKVTLLEDIGNLTWLKKYIQYHLIKMTIHHEEYFDKT